MPNISKTDLPSDIKSVDKKSAHDKVHSHTEESTAATTASAEESRRFIVGFPNT